MKNVEAKTILEGLLAHLPEDVRGAVDEFESKLRDLEQARDNELQDIGKELKRRQDDAQKTFENGAEALLEGTQKQLQTVQYQYMESGNFDAAMAVFAQIAMLSTDEISEVEALPNPGSLVGYEQIGMVYHFRVVGEAGRPVWGSGVYTSDSALATAAVHAGVIGLGESGIVSVEMVDMTNTPIVGSFENGIETSDWDHYSVGFKFI